jgi:signal transduction histidine kinase
MGGFLAGTCLLVVRRRWRWAAYAAVGAAVALASVAHGDPGPWIAYLVLSTCLTGLVVYGISSLSGLVAQVDHARGELARVAVVQERLRVARDLHDVLGRDLATMAVMSRHAYRLLPASIGPAKAEVAEVLDIARRAVANVRAVASGYRHASFAAEVDSAVSTLAAAGIDVYTQVPACAVPTELEATMALVLREAVTNVLRHSDARRCVIEASTVAGEVQLWVVNDGTRSCAVPAVHDESGLGDLAARMRAISGRLTAEVIDGSFHLTVAVPGPSA